MKNIKLFIVTFALCMYDATITPGPAASKVYSINRDYGLSAASCVAVMNCLGCDERVINQVTDTYHTKRPLFISDKSDTDETGMELTEQQLLEFSSDGPRVTVEPNGKGGWRTVFIKE